MGMSVLPHEGLLLGRHLELLHVDVVEREARRTQLPRLFTEADGYQAGEGLRTGDRRYNAKSRHVYGPLRA